MTLNPTEKPNVNADTNLLTKSHVCYLNSKELNTFNKGRVQFECAGLCVSFYFDAALDAKPVTLYKLCFYTKLTMFVMFITW